MTPPDEPRRWSSTTSGCASPTSTGRAASTSDVLGFELDRALQAPDEAAGPLALGRAAGQPHRGLPVPRIVRARAAALRPPGQPARPGRAFNEPGLTHISLSVEDMDGAVALVLERGGEVVTDLMGAVVVRDPDGQLIELLPMAYRRALDQR